MPITKVGDCSHSELVLHSIHSELIGAFLRDMLNYPTQMFLNLAAVGECYS